MPRLFKALAVILSLASFSKPVLSDSDVVCTQGGKEYKIAIVGHGYGEAHMEELIKGTYSKVACKPIITIVPVRAFDSTRDYFVPAQFEHKLREALNSIATNTELDAVLLNLDLSGIYAAAQETRGGGKEYKRILKEAAPILESAGHIKAVLIPAGNHGAKENLAFYFNGNSLPSKKFMLVASANQRGQLVGDTGFLNCQALHPKDRRGRVLKTRASSLAVTRCQQNLIVSGQAVGLQTSFEQKSKKTGKVFNARKGGGFEHKYPDTYLAASVVMWNLIQSDFDLSQMKSGQSFSVDSAPLVKRPLVKKQVLKKRLIKNLVRKIKR